MQRVTLVDEDHTSKTFLISGTETPYQILSYYHMNPDLKIVYLNGQIISNERMKIPIGTMGNIYISVRNKAITRK